MYKFLTNVTKCIKYWWIKSLILIIRRFARFGKTKIFRERKLILTSPIKNRKRKART